MVVIAGSDAIVIGSGEDEGGAIRSAIFAPAVHRA